MKRVLISGIALATVLGFTAAATAQEPAPASRQLLSVGRFHQSSIPQLQGRITGKFNTSDPDKVVSATVVLQGDSVSAAHNRAQRLGQRFDKASTERQLKAAQQTVLPRLRGAGATVRSTVHNALNAATVRVKVKDLPALAAVQGVVSVHVSYQLRRFNGTSDVYTGVPSVWGDTGLTGDGMTIGIIDDGIDYFHADFGGSGIPADYTNDDHTIIEAGTFPTEKVVGGYDFVGDGYDANNSTGTDVPVPDPDPVACGHHGTHVSGTAAGEGVLSDGSTFTGPYDAATLGDNTFLVAPGSAPQASIRMYKVFGCEGSVNDDILLLAIDMAVSDGVDVLSMSLGSDWGTADEPIAQAIDNATGGGILSVVSAGNAGPRAYLVGGPSTADTALSVAAMDASSATLPGVAITGGVTMSAQNSNLWDFGATGAVTGQLVDVGLGCTVGDYAGAVGKIAVTHRGVCDRVARAINGTTAGALAVIFVNNADGYPPVEGVIPGGNVPFVGVRLSDGASFVNGLTVTLNSAAPISNPAYTNFASFTSNGPRQDSAAKPDISAPGVNILSASVGTGTDGLLLSGTSMAAPHTAGIAILVRQAHPSWDPIAVKGAMMSAANPAGVGDFNVVRGGAGEVSAPAAVAAKAYFSTTDGRDNLSFGFRELTGGYVATRTIMITNTSSGKVTYDMSADVGVLGTGLTVRFNPTTFTVQAGQSRSISVTLRLPDPQHLPSADSDTGGGLATVNGLVFATPRVTSVGIAQLKTPLLLVPYGVSDIRAIGATSTGPAAKTQVVKSIKLGNSGVHAGNVDTYQWAVADPEGDTFDPLVPDVRDIGVQSFPISSSDSLVVFAITTHERIATAATGEYDLYIDVNQDDVADFVLVGIDNGLLTSGSPDGLMNSFLIDLTSGTIADVWGAYAPANGSTVELPFLLSDVYGGTGPSTMSFFLQSYSVVTNAPPDATDVGYFDPLDPAVSNGDFAVLDPGASTRLPVAVNPAAAAAQHTLGWLVVSVDDAASREADRVPLRARRGGRASV